MLVREGIRSDQLGCHVTPTAEAAEDPRHRMGSGGCLRLDQMDGQWDSSRATLSRTRRWLDLQAARGLVLEGGGPELDLAMDR